MEVFAVSTEGLPTLISELRVELAQKAEEAEAFAQMTPEERDWVLQNDNSDPELSESISSIKALKAEERQTRLQVVEVLKDENAAIMVSRPFEEVEKMMNRIFLDLMLSEEYTIAVDARERVKKIAAMCPMDAGEAVYKARLLYSLVDPRPQPEWDLCNKREEETRKRKEEEVKDTKVSSLTVVPNPASSEISFGASSITPWTILSIEGTPLLRGTTQLGENKISTDDLVPGFYFLQVEDVEVQTAKFIIQR